MAIEDIARRFRRSRGSTEEQPADYELVRDERARNSVRALAALLMDEELELLEREPEPTDPEPQRDLNWWLMGGIGAGAVAAGIGVAAVVRRRKKASETDDASA